jgi:hypothetical protein
MGEGTQRRLLVNNLDYDRVATLLVVSSGVCDAQGELTANSKLRARLVAAACAGFTETPLLVSEEPPAWKTAIALGGTNFTPRDRFNGLTPEQFASIRDESRSSRSDDVLLDMLLLSLLTEDSASARLIQEGAARYREAYQDVCTELFEGGREQTLIVGQPGLIEASFGLHQLLGPLGFVLSQWGQSEHEVRLIGHITGHPRFA